MKSLALRYRPQKWDEVTEQSSIVTILQNQIESGDIKGAYCFVGAAGTGKTTCARIFANEINHGEGMPIEMDAASHNGVDDVREIAKMAQTKAIDAEYKVFILDEAHMFSAGAWAAMLKLIEEPPAKCVFILCTTDYWKIPKTIQSRCQRYQFQRISTEGIFNRLLDVMCQEGYNRTDIDEGAVEYISRKSDGCMRDALTTLDKCLALSDELTMQNVTKALGLSSYETFMSLTDNLMQKNTKAVLELLERSYADGIDMKQLIKDYLHFILDVNKYLVVGSFSYTQLPQTEDIEKFLDKYSNELDDMNDLLHTVMDIDADIKWDSSPLYTIEARFMMY